MPFTNCLTITDNQLIHLNLHSMKAKSHELESYQNNYAQRTIKFDHFISNGQIVHKLPGGGEGGGR